MTARRASVAAEPRRHALTPPRHRLNVAPGSAAGSLPRCPRSRRGRMNERDGVTRRTLVKRTAAAGVAIAGGTLWATAPAAARARRFGKRKTPIEHLVISCQENRSFDHYFGYAPQVQAAGLSAAAGLHATRRGGSRPRAVRVDGAALGGSAARLERRARSSTTAARWTGSTPTLPPRTGSGDDRDAVLHRTGAARSTTACSATLGSARTTSVRCSGRPGRTAST